MTSRLSLSLIALMAGSAALLPTAAPARAAQDRAAPGVAALLEQGRYWRERGRGDLARSAYQRVLAVDPNNAVARRALAALSTPPRTAPAPSPARPAGRDTQATRPAATPAPAAGPAPTPAPVPAARVDRGGDARAAGFRALDGGDLATAERRFQTALSINRGDAEASGGLGIVRLRQSRFAEAVDLLERASARGRPSQWAEALGSARLYAGLDEARGLFERGQLAAAASEAERLAQAGGDNRPALLLLSDIYERQGRYAEAADIARRAGETPADSREMRTRIIRNEALAAAASGDNGRAESAFQSGLVLDQDDPWIRYEYARFLIDRNRVFEADQQIQAIQAITTPEASYAAALLQSQRGRSQFAQALIDRIPSASMTPAMQRFAVKLRIDGAIERAEQQAARGQRIEAAAGLRQLAATPDLDAGALASIAGALDTLGDGQGAVIVAQQALAARPETVESYEPLIRVLSRNGQDAAAAAAVDQARQLATGSTAGPGGTIARIETVNAVSQADRLRLSGQYAPAFDILQQAWAATPGDNEILASLARLYQSGGMPSQAAQTYQMVLARTPDDKGALAGLIRSASANGDHGLAASTTDRALKLHPQDPDLLAAAGGMEEARGNRRAALRYLERAQAAYAGRGGDAASPFGTANPFAGSMTASDNPFRTPAPTNPFALGGGPVRTDPGPLASPARQGAQGFYTAPSYAGTRAMPAASAYPAQGAAGGQPAPASPIAQVQQDIARLQSATGPRTDIQVGYRERSGEVGLSQLRELSGSATASTDFAGGRIGVTVTPVVIDAGRPTGSALARFGRNATEEAQAIVDARPSALAQADTQHASGVALSAAYDSETVRVEGGTTPIGIGDTRATWNLTARPRFSSSFSGQGWFRREAVAESIVAYAGTVDPVSGGRWGQVMRTGGGLSLSWDRGGSGVYGDLSGYRYEGLNVPDNRGFQGNVGGYLPLYADSSSRLTGGLNLNWQSFDNNQNYFTFGHGGYFSPQSFLSVSIPIRYAYDADPWEIRLNAAPGYQSFRQDQVVLYPTDPAAQAVLNGLKARNSDVRSFYDGLSVTGVAFAADGSLYYRVSPSTQIGATLGVNTFGTYDEYRSTFGIRQRIGGER